MVSPADGRDRESRATHETVDRRDFLWEALKASLGET